LLRNATFTLATVLTALILLAAPATAEVTRKKAMWGPLELNGASQFPVYADLGVGIYQTSLAWADVARQRPLNPRDPSDPAYSWPGDIDRAVQDGFQFGIQVSLLVQGAPAWANGGRPSQWAPTNPADFADFLRAASRRYPGVRHWMIWGEPTKAQNFQPLAADNRRPLRGEGLRGPHLYARILDAAYGALKKVSRRNLVIGGNSFTVGTVSPRRWIEALRLPNGKPPRMDLYGHNPFSARRPDLSQGTLGRGYADFSDLDSLVRWIDRNLRRRDLGGRPMRVFISEFSLPTDHANHEFNFYVSRRTQASWLASALRITRRYSRIYTFGYLGLYDDALQADGQQVERGLIDREGRHKPGYGAFRRG
jgi:hypothetical protein